MTGLDAAARRALLVQARRVTRDRADAEDLVQTVLLVAWQAGRSEPAWLAGVLRRQAALAVRGTVRRRQREQVAGACDIGSFPVEAADASSGRIGVDWLPPLPPAARRVAVLVLHGLDAAEIRWILRIAPTALRQRMTSIRKAIEALPPPDRRALHEHVAAHRPARDARVPAGRLRPLLRASMRIAPMLGSHDPDGHPLLLRGSAHTSAPRGNDSR
ncbi:MULTISPECIES: RNA polymerase sigma factor [Luteimonas]|uniref:RNA polymerase sigma factor n=1 Tax=Luteimonas TaxID=83614 RepID=UPI000C7CF216|nr:MULTISPECIES: sigma factor [Luteimonas]